MRTGRPKSSVHALESRESALKGIGTDAKVHLSEIPVRRYIQDRPLGSITPYASLCQSPVTGMDLATGFDGPRLN